MPRWDHRQHPDLRPGCRTDNGSRLPSRRKNSECGSSGSADHLKPGMVVENFMREEGEEMLPNAIRLHRIDTFMKGEDEKGTYEVPMTDTEGKYKIYL